MERLSKPWWRSHSLQWLLWLCLLLAAGAHADTRRAAVAPTSTAVTSSLEEDMLDIYRLSHGDRLSVQVYGETELSKEYVVGSNGRLSFPLLGEVQVSGLTATEVGERLTGALRGDYLIDPKVTVTVVRYRPIYVNGEVKNPGAQDYEPGLTVRQAISLAGGLTDRASPRKIYRVAASQSARGDQPQSAAQEKVGLEVRLKPGDTITVEESFF